MLTKRIIPCLDIKNGTTVKGTNFENLQHAGDPIELARRYEQEGADELVFLDIAATEEERKTRLDLVKSIAENLFIPFTVGGGINSISQIQKLLKTGADKVSLNTAAVLNPSLIKQAANYFGSQCIVIAIDAKLINNRYEVFINGGKKRSGRMIEDWIIEVETLGAGEILLTSIDQDGMKNGFDVDLYQLVTNLINIPVIASGGAGSLENILEIFQLTNVDAVLAASIFHFQEISIPEVKAFLSNNYLEVRL